MSAKNIYSLSRNVCKTVLINKRQKNLFANSSLQYNTINLINCSGNRQKEVNPKTILPSTFCTMPEIPIVNYELIKDLPNHPEILLVDVREIQEIKDTALIPTSINVPLNDVQRTFSEETTTECFEKLFNRPKPTKDQPIIFSCRSGMRAGKAAATLVQLGYSNVKNYRGSWIDWAEHEGLSSNQ